MENLRIKTYIINLAKDLERRDNIAREVGKIKCLDPEWIEAVDGKKSGKEKLGEVFDYRKSKKYQSVDLSLGEVGCTLSHFECYKKLLASEQEVALVVEDDIGFEDEEFLDEVLKLVVNYIKSRDASVLLLSAFFDYSGEGMRFYNNYKIYDVYKGALTSAYLINKSAARIIVDVGPPYWVADDWALFRRKGVRIYALSPSFVCHKDLFNSTIGWYDRFKRKKRIPRSWMELNVIVDESFRLLLKKIGIIKHINNSHLR